MPASPFRVSMLCTLQCQGGGLGWQNEKQLMIFSAYKLAATLALSKCSCDISEMKVIRAESVQSPGCHGFRAFHCSSMGA